MRDVQRGRLAGRGPLPVSEGADPTAAIERRITAPFRAATSGLRPRSTVYRPGKALPRESGFCYRLEPVGKVRLDSLKLSGFKSFPDEVQLSFPGAVCAILGPNGSGKSNLVDAMLWVLGEQSPSLLRLKNMGDVVFNGSGRRKPAGSATVEIVLRSADSRWAENGGKLEIRRKVLRSGPSEYRMNGKTVRLKDISDELLAVGLGTRSYSIIEQGRIGQVLSARPTDRRVLLEEAAGITRYKARKHEAELKLERTRQNLLRLDDVIDEVSRSLRQLKRQARQAEKYTKLQEELHWVLRRSYSVEALDLATRRKSNDRARGEILNEVAAAASSLGSAEADLAGSRQELEKIRKELEEQRGEIASLDASGEGLEAFLERSEDLVENLEDSLKRNARSRMEIDQQLRSIDETSRELLGIVEERSRARRRAEEELEKAAEVHKDKHRKLKEQEEITSRCRKDLLRTVSSLTAARNRLAAFEREQDRISYSLSQLDSEKKRLEKRSEEVVSRHAGAREATKAADELAAKLEEERAALASRKIALRNSVQEIKENSEKISSRMWEARHELTGIERDLSRVDAAMEKIAAELPGEILLGRVGDFLDPDPAHIRHMDRVWADEIDLPVLDGTRVDQDLLEYLAATEEGLRVVVTSEDLPDDMPDPAVGDAASLLDAASPAEKHRSWLERTLPRAFFLHEAERARSLALRHPGYRFLDGENRLYCGAAIDFSPASEELLGTLGLRSRKSELLALIEDLETRAGEASREHGKLLKDLSGVEDQLTELDGRCLAAEQERARRVALEESLKRELDGLRRELEAVEKEQKRIADLMEGVRERHRRMEAEKQQAEQRSEVLERDVEEANRRLEDFREELNRAIRTLDARKAEERLAREREETSRREASQLSRQKTMAEGRLGSLEKQEAELQGDLEKTRAEIVRSRTRLLEEQARLKAARQQEILFSEKTEDVLKKVRGLEEEVRRRRSVHETAREKLHEIELERTEIHGRWQGLEERCREDLGHTLESLCREAEDEKAESTETIESLRTRTDEIRKKLEAAGPVNLLAVEESTELGERKEFLDAQRKDLLEALRSLDGTISEIDATCKERFLETFEEVNSVFDETFRYLFGGGRAGLELVDPDQPLDSGLDITAQPPGKKNQSVQLLSGGEKALTAIALLISLFRVKPSPFCILDEVDAPLDDANVERLGELVRSMTTHTQFIMITHNRRTMQRCDILYGVTMEEPGVSKVVSARLDD